MRAWREGGLFSLSLGCSLGLLRVSEYSDIHGSVVGGVFNLARLIVVSGLDHSKCTDR